MLRSAGAALVLTALLTLPAAGQWPVGRGAYWAKVSVFHHRTTEQFRSDGVKRPFLASNAKSKSSAVYLDALVGATDRLDLWVQVPYFDLHFDDDLDNRHSTGVGDVRISARYNLLQLWGGSVPISVRFTTKIPVVDFPIDAEIIPVGEGQWDYEAWLEAGVSLWPLPAYGVLWLGHRWRAINDETTRDPGNEIAVLAEFGGTLAGRLGGKVVLDAIFGQDGASQGVKVSNDQREIMYLNPNLTFQVTPRLSVEGGVRVPLHGKNFPAGHQFTLGFFHRSGEGE